MGTQLHDPNTPPSSFIHKTLFSFHASWSAVMKKDEESVPYVSAVVLCSSFLFSPEAATSQTIRRDVAVDMKTVKS